MQQQIVQAPEAAKVVGVETHHHCQVVHPSRRHQSLESQVLVQALSSFLKDLLGNRRAWVPFCPIQSNIFLVLYT